jgi:hypothetical protein
MWREDHLSGRRLHPITNQNREPGKPKLLDELRIFMCTRRYNLRIEQAYLDWIRRFILFQGKRHPRDTGENVLGQKEIRPLGSRAVPVKAE